MEIRDAVMADASAACQVLRRSIQELCVTDHGNDPEILAQWLRNKTPEKVASWMANPECSMLIAVENAIMLGVGMVADAGDIHLLYVSPDIRFRGVSKKLLTALEERTRQRGGIKCSAVSTETARRFYLAAGFAEDGQPVTLLGVRCYPMSKLLVVRHF